jgi:hypothetical protein
MRFRPQSALKKTINIKKIQKIAPQTIIGYRNNKKIAPLTPVVDTELNTVPTKKILKFQSRRYLSC